MYMLLYMRHYPLLKQIEVAQNQYLLNGWQEYDSYHHLLLIQYQDMFY